ncbi:hypothetical protein [Roseateles sp. P5_E11]
MTIAPDGEFRVAHFGSGELHVLSRSDKDKPPVEVLYVRTAEGGAILVKGVAAAEVDNAARESPWLALESAPVLSALADAFKDSPCGSAGRHAATVAKTSVPGSASSRFVGATITAVIERPGEVSFDIRFPNSSLPTYAGRLSYLEPAPSLPESTVVGGFSVVRMGSRTFVAPDGMTAAQLRIRLSQDRP